MRQPHECFWSDIAVSLAGRVTADARKSLLVLRQRRAEATVSHLERHNDVTLRHSELKELSSSPNPKSARLELELLMLDKRKRKWAHYILLAVKLKSLHAVRFARMLPKRGKRCG